MLVAGCGGESVVVLKGQSGDALEKARKVVTLIPPYDLTGEWEYAATADDWQFTVRTVTSEGGFSHNWTIVDTQSDSPRENGGSWGERSSPSGTEAEYRVVVETQNCTWSVQVERD